MPSSGSMYGRWATSRTPAWCSPPAQRRSAPLDPLKFVGKAAWTHVDAAWAGPLRLSEPHKDRLAGIEQADSVAVSAHKLLFQPKESGLVLFRDVARANDAISFGGSYLAVANVGVLGSHGAVAVPLLGTLLAWG